MIPSNDIEFKRKYFQCVHNTYTTIKQFGVWQLDMSERVNLIFQSFCQNAALIISFVDLLFLCATQMIVFKLIKWCYCTLQKRILRIVNWNIKKLSISISGSQRTLTKCQTRNSRHHSDSCYSMNKMEFLDILGTRISITARGKYCVASISAIFDYASMEWKGLKYDLSLYKDHEQKLHFFHDRRTGR